MNFLQTVLENSGISAEEKIKQLQSYVETIEPEAWDSEEEITRFDDSDNNLWVTINWSFDTEGVATRISRRYRFIPQIDGSRILDGEFVEYFPDGNTIRYHAVYNDGLIQKSCTNYPSGNVKLECYYHENGTLDAEYHFPDNREATRLGQESMVYVSCNNEYDRGHCSKFAYITGPDGTNQQITLEYTDYQYGFKHGTYTSLHPDGGTKCLGGYYRGKMDGVFRGFFPNGQPHYYQEWSYGSLDHELVWNRDGHLVENIYPEQDMYYSSNGVLVEKRTLLSNSNWLVTIYSEKETIQDKYEETPDGVVVRKMPPPKPEPKFPDKFDFNKIDNKINNKFDCNFDYLKSFSKYTDVKLLAGHPCATFAANRIKNISFLDGRKKRWDDNFNRALDYGFRQIIIDDGVPQTQADTVLQQAREYFSGYAVGHTQSNIPGACAIYVIVPEVPEIFVQ